MSRDLIIIAQAQINDLNLYLYQGSSIQVSADCLVNAANDEMRHGGGLALEISQQAGNSFDRECEDWIRKNGKIRPGQVAVTGSHRLTQFKKIIHAVGPKGEDSTENSNMLISTLVNSFKAAADLGFNSISVPALSVGIFGYPMDISAERHFQAVYIFAQQLQKYPSLKNIAICLFKDEEARVFSEKFIELSDYFPIFQYFGTSKEIGMVIGMGHCKLCQTSVDEMCFEFTNSTCGCRQVCDFCIGKNNSPQCFNCGVVIAQEYYGVSRCRKCKNIYQTGIYHNC